MKMSGENMCTLLMFLFILPFMGCALYMEQNLDRERSKGYQLANLVTKISGGFMAITFLIAVTVFDMWC